MLAFVLLLSVLLPIACLAYETRRRPAQHITLTHFWYFTLIWTAAFPLRTWLLTEGHVIAQVNLRGVDTGWAPIYDANAYAVSLSIALFFWLISYMGYRSVASPTGVHNRTSLSETKTPWRAQIVLLALIAAGVGVMLYLNPSSETLDSNNYQQARMGSGVLWLIPELSVFATLAFIAYFIANTNKKITLRDYALISVGLVASIWLGGEIFSRRLFASVALALLILIVVRNPRFWVLGVLSLFGTVFASSIMEFARRLPYALNAGTDTQSLTERLVTTYDIIIGEQFLHFLSTSFEGAEHLTHYLHKSTWFELFTGIDYGVSWAFNSGLSLVPRMIWIDKPTIYGGISQLQWMYPSLFRGDFAATAPPMSFVVDFAFGFGIVAALILTFYLGRFLKACEIRSWNGAGGAGATALTLIVFLYMFNIVRGGSAFGQTFIIFTAVTILMYGWTNTLSGAIGILMTTFSRPLRLQKGDTDQDAVFFYPHAYLRDRQLDTITNWTKEKVLNPEIVDNRQGAQVSRDQAIKPGKASWKTRLPLINVKLRPHDAPSSAPVFVWGGLMLNGPFIVNIDNPYAFCAYNPLAVKLYRPIIRAILEQPRCLEIRCLSRACQESLRAEFGDYVADKSVIDYPKFAPPLETPVMQNDGPCKFLFVSTQFEIKGGGALLKAFETVLSTVTDAELHLVTHLPEQFQARVNDNPNIHVHPATFTRDDISERFLKTNHVLVHPTYFDSFGMVVLEALRMGMPIIATDVYAIREMVHDQVNGVLLSSPISIWDSTSPGPLFSDVEKVRQASHVVDTTGFENDLTNAMLQLAQDKGLRESYGQESLKLYKTTFASHT